MPAVGQGRDVGFATQAVDLIHELDADRKDDRPWLMVASFVNPHDIALWGYIARASDQFNFSGCDYVPGFQELFDPVLFERTLTDDLGTKPTCQESSQTSYHEWMQGIPPDNYFRFYYQLHVNVDKELMKVYGALHKSDVGYTKHTIYEKKLKNHPQDVLLLKLNKDRMYDLILTAHQSLEVFLSRSW